MRRWRSQAVVAVAWLLCGCTVTAPGAEAFYSDPGNTDTGVVETDTGAAAADTAVADSGVVDSGVVDSGVADVDQGPFTANPCWETKCTTAVNKCKASTGCVALAACVKKGGTVADCAQSLGNNAQEQSLFAKIETCGYGSCTAPSQGSCSAPGKNGSANRCDQRDPMWLCNCDQDCVVYGDCCSDLQSVCYGTGGGSADAGGSETTDTVKSPECGNGICEIGEAAATCPVDCKAAYTCGDGLCGQYEGMCAKDCLGGCVAQNCSPQYLACENDQDCAGLYAFIRYGNCYEDNGCSDAKCGAKFCTEAMKSCQASSSCMSLYACISSCSDQSCIDETCVAPLAAKLFALQECLQDKCGS